MSNLPSNSNPLKLDIVKSLEPEAEISAPAEKVETIEPAPLEIRPPSDIFKERQQKKIRKKVPMTEKKLAQLAKMRATAKANRERRKLEKQGKLNPVAKKEFKPVSAIAERRTPVAKPTPAAHNHGQPIQPNSVSNFLDQMDRMLSIQAKYKPKPTPRAAAPAVVPKRAVAAPVRRAAPIAIPKPVNKFSNYF